MVIPGKDNLLDIINKWKTLNDHPSLYGDGKAADKIIFEMENRILDKNKTVHYGNILYTLNHS